MFSNFREVAPRRLRYELKYIVGLEEGLGFLQELSPYCSVDPHSGPDNVYEIASIYYDTADLRFYRDREESVGHRRKVRLRTYNLTKSPPFIFLEIKEKHKHLVGKKKCPLPPELWLGKDLKHLNIPLDELLLDAEDSSCKREILYLNSRLGLYPVANVRYVRHALLGNFESDLRITLDKRLTAGGAALETYDPEEETFILPPEKAVLEIKSNHTLPIWLLSALRRYQYFQVRVSKYCLAVQNLGLFKHYMISPGLANIDETQCISSKEGD